VETWVKVWFWVITGGLEMLLVGGIVVGGIVGRLGATFTGGTVGGFPVGAAPAPLPLVVVDIY